MFPSDTAFEELALLSPKSRSDSRDSPSDDHILDKLDDISDGSPVPRTPRRMGEPFIDRTFHHHRIESPGPRPLSDDLDWDYDEDGGEENRMEASLDALDYLDSDDAPDGLDSLLDPPQHLDSDLDLGDVNLDDVDNFDYDLASHTAWTERRIHPDQHLDPLDPLTSSSPQNDFDLDLDQDQDDRCSDISFGSEPELEVDLDDDGLFGEPEEDDIDLDRFHWDLRDSGARSPVDVQDKDLDSLSFDKWDGDDAFIAQHEFQRIVGPGKRVQTDNDQLFEQQEDFMTSSFEVYRQSTHPEAYPPNSAEDPLPLNTHRMAPDRGAVSPPAPTHAPGKHSSLDDRRAFNDIELPNRSHTAERPSCSFCPYGTSSVYRICLLLHEPRMGPRSRRACTRAYGPC